MAPAIDADVKAASVPPPPLPPPALVVDVHSNAVKFTSLASGTSFQLNVSAAPAVLEALSRQRLTPELLDLFDAGDFRDGVAFVEVRDHRLVQRQDSAGGGGIPASTSASAGPAHGLDLKPRHPAQLPSHGLPSPPAVLSFPLFPSPEATWASVLRIANTGVVGPAGLEDMLLDVEADILRATEPLCLDPTPAVAVLGGVVAYNESKYRGRRKRARDQLEREEEAAELKQNVRLLLVSDRSLILAAISPKIRFSRLHFIEEYRRKKAQSDAEVMVGMEFFKKKTKKTAPIPPSSRFNQRNVFRTVRFEQETHKGTLHTILNIVETGRPDDYEAILRYGNTEGTALGPHGGTLRFPVGNAAAAESYLSIFKNFYGINHKLKSG